MVIIIFPAREETFRLNVIVIGVLIVLLTELLAGLREVNVIGLVSAAVMKLQAVPVNVLAGLARSIKAPAGIFTLKEVLEGRLVRLAVAVMPLTVKFERLIV